MKLWIIGVLMLFLLPSVSARLVVDALEYDRYNIGDVVEVSGYLVEGVTAQASMNIDLVCKESKLVYFSFVNIEADKRFEFDADVPLMEESAGNCSLNVVFELPNLRVEQNSHEFSVSDELDIVARLDYTHRKPGEGIKVSGNVLRANGNNLGEGGVTIVLSGRSYGTEVVGGTFEKSIVLLREIKTGNQPISISVEDDAGNKGEAILNIFVDPVSTELVLVVNKESFKPGEIIKVVPDVYDQGGELVRRDVVISLLDVDGDERYKKVVDSSGTYGIALDQFAVPGNWRLQARADQGLADEVVIYVEEAAKTEMRLEGGMLYVTNVGNVEITEPLEINLEGAENYRIIEKSSIKPNQTIAIDISKEVPPGEYRIDVPSFSGVTGNVVLEGKKVEGNGIFAYIALIFVAVFLAYMILSRGRRKVSRRDLAREKGKRILGRARDERVECVVKPKEEEKVQVKQQRKAEFGKPTKEDIDYAIRKAKESSNKYDDPIKPGMFNMFNR